MGVLLNPTGQVGATGDVDYEALYLPASASTWAGIFPSAVTDAGGLAGTFSAPGFVTPGLGNRYDKFSASSHQYQLNTWLLDVSGLTPPSGEAVLYAAVSGPRSESNLTGTYRHYVAPMSAGQYTRETFYPGTGSERSGAVPVEGFVTPSGLAASDYWEYEAESEDSTEGLFVPCGNLAAPFALVSMIGWHYQGTEPTTSSTSASLIFDVGVTLLWGDPATPPAQAVYGWGVLL